MPVDQKSAAKLATKREDCGKNHDFSLGNNNNGNEVFHMLKPYEEYAAGLIAAVVNTSFLFPVNKLIFRQMAGGFNVLVAYNQMKSEGVSFVYRGILPPLIQKMCSVSIMFGSFGHYKKWADGKFTNSSPIATLAIASCLTGTTEAILTPLERVQMLLQDGSYHKNYKNTYDAFVKLKPFGVSEYYRGLTCVLVRNGPSNILFFGLRDKIKELIFGEDASLTRTNQQLQQASQISQKQIGSDKTIRQNKPAQNFLSGAILGMFISTLFYPLSVVRTRMQTRAPGTEFLSIVKAFNDLYSERDRKFSRLFHGCSINIARQFLSWGIINCSYEVALVEIQNLRERIFN